MIEMLLISILVVVILIGIVLKVMYSSIILEVRDLSFKQYLIHSSMLDNKKCCNVKGPVYPYGLPIDTLEQPSPLKHVEDITTYKIPYEPRD